MFFEDEYFCPNCDAVLNDQFGFDPSLGAWRCTSCGQTLIGDDVYDGEKYDGIAWFCDGCNALLNKQFGFTDMVGIWVCTACGHVNPINEDEIIDEDEEYIECPECGDNLVKQYGFYEGCGEWECSECGAFLKQAGFNEYEAVEVKCPNCEANLLKQYGFYDGCDCWKCAECGKELHSEFGEYIIKEEKEVCCGKERVYECPACFSPLNDQDYFDEDEENWTCEICGEKLVRDVDGDYVLMPPEKATASKSTTAERIDGAGALMICHYCKKTITKDSVFCCHCGRKVEIKTKPLFCWKCGTKLIDGAKYCYMCGNKI